MFEKAARMKLRFATTIGYLSVEDLWELPLKNLDAVAVGLHQELKNDNTSFISEEKPDLTMQLRFDIAKHIIDVRLAEQRARAEARDKAARKQQILGILARKQDAKLESASEDELRGLLASL